MRKKIFSIFFISTILVGLKSSAQIEIKKDSLSCKIHFESIKTLKRLSDEYFLNGRDSIAKETYLKALQKLGYIDGNLTCPNIRDSANLYKLDILYRIYLLNEHVDFWGFQQYKPLNPVFYYNKFNLTYQDFENIAKEIEVLIDKIDLEQDKVNTQTSTQDQNNINAAIETINNEKNDLYQDFYSNSIQQYKQRIQSINIRQNEIEDEAKQTSNELEQVNSNLNGIMLKGLSQAVGLPVSLQSIDLKSSVKDNLFSIGKTLITNNPTVKEAVGQISEQMSGLVSLYNQVDSVRKKAENILDVAKKARTIIREPTLENLLQIGGSILNNVGASDLNNLKTAFSKVKSIQTLFHNLDNFKDAKRRVIDEIFKDKTILQNYVNSVIEEKELQRKLFVALINRYINITNEASKMFIITEFIRLHANEFWQLLDINLHDKLKQFLNTSEDEVVLKYLSKFEFDANSAIEFANDELKIQGISITKKVDTLFSTLVNNAKGIAKSNESEARDMVNKLFNTGVDQLSNLIKEDLDFFEIENSISSVFEGIDNAKLEQLRSSYYDKIFGSINGLVDMASIEKNILSTNVASFYLNNNAPVGDVDFKPTVVTQNLSTSQQWQKAIVTGAISYACPYVGMAISFYTAFSKRSRLLEKLKSLNQEQSDLTARKLQMLDMLDQTYLQLRLTEKEKQINDLRKQSAIRTYYSIRSGIRANIEKMGESRIKISNRKPLLFFLSEKLREYSRMIDKALVYRHNIDLSSAILNDPSNMRLILDDDIHLSTWLDLSKDGIRSDLEKMRTTWRSYKILLDQYCTVCQEQSIPELDCGQTSTISLKENFPEEWAKFYKAIKNKSTKFDFRLPIFPGQRQNIINDSLMNLRFLDVRIISMDTSGNYFKINNISLGHPGVAYVFNGNRFIKEIFPPSMLNGVVTGLETLPANTLKERPPSFDENIYRKGWQEIKASENYPRLKGYGMFSEWALTIPLNADVEKIKDISIRFIYSFQSSLTKPIKGLFTITKDLPQGTKPISDFKIFNSEEEFSNRVQYLITKYKELWNSKK